MRNSTDLTVVRRAADVALAGNAPTIEIAMGYNRTNTSPIPMPVLSLLDELRHHPNLWRPHAYPQDAR
jgi:hypothetical protein